jgi:hypothetical protein
MKQLLADIVRQVSPLFEKIRVTGLDDGTKVEAYTEDKMLFLFADLKGFQSDLVGEFGISNLPLLRGLLEFATYNTDGAKFNVHRTERDGNNYVSELEFSAAGEGRAVFRTINPRIMGDRARIAPINWGVSVTPSKAKITEIIQLTGMLSQVEQHFAVNYENHTLFLTIGAKGTNSHNASVALTSDINCEGLLPLNSVFKAPHFLGVLKNAGNQPCTIRFCKDGVSGILIETNHGTYNYLLRGTEI